MLLDPLGREPGDRRERAGLREQVICAVDHRQLMRTAQDRAGLAVQREHLGVAVADEQQRGRNDPGQAIAGQIGAASAGDDGANRITQRRGRSQGSGRAG